jgi:septum site-determining protein MinD
MFIRERFPRAQFYDPAEIKTHVEQTFDCPVAAVLPHSDEMMKLASSDIFVLRYPDHSLTAALREVAVQLVE